MSDHKIHYSCERNALLNEIVCVKCERIETECPKNRINISFYKSELLAASNCNMALIVPLGGMNVTKSTMILTSSILDLCLKKGETKLLSEIFNKNGSTS